MLSYRYWVTNGLLIALALFLLYNLAMVAFYGAIEVREPNLVILWAEAACMAAIISLGGYNLVKDLREYRGDHHGGKR